VTPGGGRCHCYVRPVPPGGGFSCGFDWVLRDSGPGRLPGVQPCLRWQRPAGRRRRHARGSDKVKLPNGVCAMRSCACMLRGAGARAHACVRVIVSIGTGNADIADPGPGKNRFSPGRVETGEKALSVPGTHGSHARQGRARPGHTSGFNRVTSTASASQFQACPTHAHVPAFTASLSGARWRAAGAFFCRRARRRPAPASDGRQQE
jgi:hypothetical protein